MALKQIANAQAEVGYIVEAIHTADRIKDEFTHVAALLEIARKQARGRDTRWAADTLGPAVRSSKGLRHNSHRDWAFGDIAESQARNGDIAGAIRTVELVGIKSDWVLAKLASAQAKSGDIAGAVHTAERIEEDHILYQALMGSPRSRPRLETSVERCGSLTASTTSSGAT